ncbi:MAG: VanW family protein [Parcubacteria group bacterium]
MGSFYPFVTFATNNSPLPIAILTIDGQEKETITTTDIQKFTSIHTKRTQQIGYQSEIEKPVSCFEFTSPPRPCLITAYTRDAYATKITSQVSIDGVAIKTFVEDIARKINTDPVNAKLSFSPETQTFEEIEPHADGITIDVEKNVAQITEKIANRNNPVPLKIALIYDTKPATVTHARANALGIVELIGEGRSNFKGSTQSRIHNIQTAAKRFDGLVIAPNEEFSFTTILGPVDGEHGYKEELVIRDNETKPEFGGGICQVSTTVFRGAIFTGMKITQRHNHSYPVHYYTPTGFDATVYVPKPDLRFINNTPGYVLLTVKTEGTELVFDYYGKKDGRTVKMEGPFVTDRQPDGAMKTYFTQKVTDKDGNIIVDDVFKSNYKSPNDYPHPGDVAKLDSKPDNWSKKQWDDYKKANGL